MTTLADLLGNLRADSPALLAVAGVVLAAAAALGRRLMGSLRRFGGRLGALEVLATSERTRRRQVEAELLGLGIPLPYWPEDPVNAHELAVLRRRVAVFDREDLDHEHNPPTTEAQLPPVPTSTSHRR